MALIRFDKALFCLLIANLGAAFYSPIQDCDEVFNYWEAAHYVLHGYGLQTWELSPQYSIRSWLYIVIHAAPIKTSELVGRNISKKSQFLVLRMLLASVNTIAQQKPFESIRRYVNPQAAWYYVLVACTGAGNFISASSFLPNSFVMYCMTMAMSSFMDVRARNSVADGITWIAAATLLGWPFVGLLSAPFAVYCVCQSLFVNPNIQMPQLIKAFCRALVLLVGRTRNRKLE